MSPVSSKILALSSGPISTRTALSSWFPGPFYLTRSMSPRMRRIGGLPEMVCRSEAPVSYINLKKASIFAMGCPFRVIGPRSGFLGHDARDEPFVQEMQAVHPLEGQEGRLGGPEVREAALARRPLDAHGPAELFAVGELDPDRPP